jgi:type IV pilus assembly protein PilB
MAVIRKEIGDLLVDNGVITEDELDLVRQERQKTGDSVVGILSRLGLANESHLKNALELQYGVNFVSLCKGKNPPEPDAVLLLPDEVMRLHNLVCIILQGDRVTVAMVDPSDINAVEDVKSRLPGKQIKSVVCVEDDLHQFLDNFFEDRKHTQADSNGSRNNHILGPDAVKKAEAVVEKVTPSPSEDIPEPPQQPVLHLDPLPGSKSKSPTVVGLEAISPEMNEIALAKRAQEEAIVLLANQILGGAIKRHCSNIHILPGERESTVYYRSNGTLYADRKLPKTVVTAVIARYKMMARLNLAEKGVCQDGHIKVKSAAKEIVCLISIVPTSHGEHISIWIV